MIFVFENLIVDIKVDFMRHDIHRQGSAQIDPLIYSYPILNII